LLAGLGLVGLPRSSKIRRRPGSGELSLNSPLGKFCLDGIGPQITTMTDRDIVDVFNGVMAAQERLLLGWNKTAVEIQPGKRQIERPVGTAR
jgi:hypothetical protein